MSLLTIIVSFVLLLILGAARLVGVLGPVVLDAELYAAQLHDVAAAQFVVQVVLCRFRVPDHHEHFIVHIFVWDWITLGVSRSLCHQCIVLYRELTVRLPHNDHGFRFGIKVFRLRADGDELDIIVDSEDLSSSLCFDVLLRYVLGLVVKETVGVP